MQPNSNNKVDCAVTIRKQLKESKQMENQRQHSNNAPTFDMIPMLMANLLEDNKILSAKIDALNKKINMSMTTKKDDDNERMDVTEAQKYIPGHPAVQTIYGWTSNGQIPYHKIGKRIYFIKSELDEWPSHGQHKSTSDLQKEAEEYVARYRK